jgi:hypothetical protein
MEQRMFKCPGLEKDLKVTNPQEFCKGAEKTDTFVEENGLTSNQYVKILEKDRSSCEEVTQLYNICIDADNTLYPDSNYKRCFSQENSLYMCSKIEKYEIEDAKIV